LEDAVVREARRRIERRGFLSWETELFTKV
jgi:hypothetical protein